LQKGADDYVIKGSEFNELRYRVERLSTTRHLADPGGADCSATDDAPHGYH
jgi:DNA-binding response OmpR family regulator